MCFDNKKMHSYFNLLFITPWCLGVKINMKSYSITLQFVFWGSYSKSWNKGNVC